MAEHSIAYGHCAEPAEDAHPEVEESVEYASDEGTVKQAVEEASGVLGDEEKEEFGI